MSIFTGDCPRCNAKHTTFDARSGIQRGIRHSWQRVFEAFCICRHCHRSSIFVLSDNDIDVSKHIGADPFLEFKGSLDGLLRFEGLITLKDKDVDPPPEFVPDDIGAAFDEGAKCLSVGCHNASAAMFRLAVDLTTRRLLPAEDNNGLNSKIRRSLGLRLEWLFKNQILPESLQDLSNCIKDDGNDGAHDGNLQQADAEDLKDFTKVLLERIFTEPARIEEARRRRAERHAAKG